MDDYRKELRQRTMSGIAFTWSGVSLFTAAQSLYSRRTLLQAKEFSSTRSFKIVVRNIWCSVSMATSTFRVAWPPKWEARSIQSSWNDRGDGNTTRTNVPTFQPTSLNKRPHSPSNASYTPSEYDNSASSKDLRYFLPSRHFPLSHPCKFVRHSESLHASFRFAYPAS